MATNKEYKLIPGCSKYEINNEGAVRNAKMKTPVFATKGTVSVRVMSDTGQRITINSLDMAKQLFGEIASTGKGFNKTAKKSAEKKSAETTTKKAVVKTEKKESKRNSEMKKALAIDRKEVLAKKGVQEIVDCKKVMITEKIYFMNTHLKMDYLHIIRALNLLDRASSTQRCIKRYVNNSKLIARAEKNLKSAGIL